MTDDPAGDSERDALLAVLAAAAAPVRFWWRDDDAADATPRLDRLLDLRRHYRVPLALAIIPARATERLARRLADEPEIAVLQHGWRHDGHAPAGSKEAEFGDHRPLPDMLAELREGHAVMERLFAANFLPVLVPPWNRVGEDVRAARQEVGLPGLSGFRKRPPPDAHTANTHLDPIAWLTTRSALGREDLFRYLRIQTEARLAGDTTAIGILSHHVVQDDAVWAVLDEILRVLRSSKAATWPSIASVFGLSAPDPERVLRRAL